MPQNVLLIRTVVHRIVFVEKRENSKKPENQY